MSTSVLEKRCRDVQVGDSHNARVLRRQDMQGTIVAVFSMPGVDRRSARKLRVNFPLQRYCWADADLIILYISEASGDAAADMARRARAFCCAASRR